MMRNTTKNSPSNKVIGKKKTPLTAVERAKISMERHKAGGGGDKHWRLSRRAMEYLEFIMDETGEKTEQKVIERLLLQEVKRIRPW